MSLYIAEYHLDKDALGRTIAVPRSARFAHLACLNSRIKPVLYLEVDSEEPFAPLRYCMTPSYGPTLDGYLHVATCLDGNTALHLWVKNEEPWEFLTRTFA